MVANESWKIEVLKKMYMDCWKIVLSTKLNTSFEYVTSC